MDKSNSKQRMNITHIFLLAATIIWNIKHLLLSLRLHTLFQLFPTASHDIV